MNKIRLFILLLILFLTVNAGATQYYVDNTCTYNGDGTTTDCAASAGATGAFHSLDDADGKAGGYAAGDIISLKKGQTYYETFTVPSSGSAGNPITINSYGTGNKPIITGEFKDPSWSTYDDGRAVTDVRGGTDKWRYDIPRRTVDLDELHYNSPAIYGGTDLSLTGGDRLGVPLRDSAHPTIGSREKYQKIF